MMYLLFLAIVYKLEGGRFLSFVQAVLGNDVAEDETPTSPCACDPGAEQSKSADAAWGWDANDGAGGNGSAPLGSGTPTTSASVGDKSRALSALGLSASKGGGTFAVSYERLPSWQADGEEDIGGGGAGTGPLSLNSDVGAAERATETATGAEGGKSSWFLSVRDRQVLKRRTILARITPLVFLSSFVADLDLITDWVFLHYGLAGQGYVIRQLALLFAISGTVMWALSTTEFSLMSKLKSMWKVNPLSELQHVGLGWQLLANVFIEDVPQFVITAITRPASVTGVLNLSASGLSLCAKVVHGISSQRAPSLATQFNMIDQDPAVTRNLFKMRDEAKKKAKIAEKLVYLAWENRCSTGKQKAAAVFQVLQMDPTFGNGDLDYMRADLFSGSRLFIPSCALTGTIPAQIGDLTILSTVILCRNKHSGPIPAEIGNLINLDELDLSENELCGLIPVELAQLSLLRILNLSNNALTGSIPVELSGLNLMTSVKLSHNRLTGGIPRELSGLSVLQELDLSHNRLTGPIPEEIGDELSSLRLLSVGFNVLTGQVPMSLSRLSKLQSLVVAHNMLTDAEETEDQLKLDLHPKCLTDFLPQGHPEEEEPTEEAQKGPHTQLTV